MITRFSTLLLKSINFPLNWIQVAYVFPRVARDLPYYQSKCVEPSKTNGVLQPHLSFQKSCLGVTFEQLQEEHRRNTNARPVDKIRLIGQAELTKHVFWGICSQEKFDQQSEGSKMSAELIGKAWRRSGMLHPDLNKCFQNYSLTFNRCVKFSSLLLLLEALFKVYESETPKEREKAEKSVIGTQKFSAEFSKLLARGCNESLAINELMDQVTNSLNCPKSITNIFDLIFDMAEEQRAIVKLCETVEADLQQHPKEVAIQNHKRLYLLAITQIAKEKTDRVAQLLERIKNYSADIKTETSKTGTDYARMLRKFE